VGYGAKVVLERVMRHMRGTNTRFKIVIRLTITEGNSPSPVPAIKETIIRHGLCEACHEALEAVTAG